MSFFESAIEKLNPTEIGNHLRNYLNLFIKPVSVWKKVFENDNDGYNLLILHLIYYCFFSYLFIHEFEAAIKYTLYEALFTVIPFSFFILPFLLYSKLFKKNYHGIKLFRLFLIIKMQFLPVLILIISLVEYLKSEPLYTIPVNFELIIWICFVVVVPGISQIKFWQKIIWAFTNYIFSLFCFLLIGYVLMSLNDTQLLKKISYETPDSDYNTSPIPELYSTLNLNDTRCLTVVKKNEPDRGKKLHNYYVTNPLYICFLGSKISETNAHISKYNDLAAVINDIIKRKNFPDSLRLSKKPLMNDYHFMPFTKSRLDSFSITIDESFDTLLNAVTRFKDSAKFESNKRYFNLLFEYLNLYKNSYTSIAKISDMTSSKKADGLIYLEDSCYAIMFQVDSNYYNPVKKRLLTTQAAIERRSRKYNLFLQIYLWPLNPVIDLMV